MVATSGKRLLHEDAVGALRALIARARVATPNLPEAAALLGEQKARDEKTMYAQAQKLLALGADAVLIKGGHGSGPESVDLLVEGRSCTRFAMPRIQTQNSHGSGCTLASAIAAGLAKNLALVDAVREAKTYVSDAIKAANEFAIRVKVGNGAVSTLKNFAPAAWLARQISANVIMSPWQ
jgi:hydroxymethylpyrimidine/phosphomethylpyrimidine kinase